MRQQRHRPELECGRRVWLGVALLSVVCALGLQVLGDCVYGIVGSRWLSQCRELALSLGFPPDFVARYLSFVLLKLPGWIGLGVFTFVVAITGWRYSRCLGMSVSLLYPLTDVASFCVFSWLRGLGFPSWQIFLTSIVGISLFAIPIGIGFGRLGDAIRRKANSVSGGTPFTSWGV